VVLTSAELISETDPTAASPSLHCYVLYPSLDNSNTAVNKGEVDNNSSEGKVLNVTRIEVSKLAGTKS